MILMWNFFMKGEVLMFMTTFNIILYELIDEMKDLFVT